MLSDRVFASPDELAIPLRTAIYSTGSLSRRIYMLTQSRTNHLSALGATLVAGIVAVPLVFAFAAHPEQTSKAAPTVQQSAGAQAAILRGRVRSEAGAPLADVRVRVAVPAADMRFVDASTAHKQLEVKSDANGDYRLELPGITKPTTISIDAMKPGYRRLVGTLMSGGDARKLEVAPGAVTEASPLILVPALHFAGTVVDEQGKPILAVKVSADSVFAGGSGGVERTTSHSDGSFELFNYPVKARVRQNEVTKGAVYFFHPDYIDRRIDDLYAIAPDERESLRIVLGTGRKITGTVFDVAGKPVPNVMIKAILKDGAHRKATRSDSNGKFALRGLSDGLTKFSARALAIKQKIDLPMAINSDKIDLEVRLKTITLPINLKMIAVLGMQLADVTPELRSAYDLFNERGALILDPGRNSGRLEIGRLAEGYCFWMVGDTRIGSVHEFVNQILTETAGREADEYSVRVVYTLSTLNFDGTNTQYLKLTKDDLKHLRSVSDQLANESR
jgi:hypothetical protein